MSAAVTSNGKFCRGKQAYVYLYIYVYVFVYDVCKRRIEGDREKRRTLRWSFWCTATGHAVFRNGGIVLR